MHIVCDAYFSIYHSKHVLESAGASAPYKVNVKMENVAGVKLPVFTKAKTDSGEAKDGELAEISSCLVHAWVHVLMRSF